MRTAQKTAGSLKFPSGKAAGHSKHTSRIFRHFFSAWFGRLWRTGLLDFLIASKYTTGVCGWAIVHAHLTIDSLGSVDVRGWSSPHAQRKANSGVQEQITASRV
jgi:hypothetical protein